MDEATPSESGAPVEGSSEGVGAEASAAGGSAPASGGDAQVVGSGSDGGAPEGSPSGESEAAAAFRILNREFRDQKHAEEVLGSEIGAKRGLQRQNADLTKKLQQYEALLENLQGQNLRGNGSGGNVQAPKQEATEEVKSFAEHLAKSGELEYLNKLAQNPEIGVAGAIYEALKAKETWDQQHGNEGLQKEISGLKQLFVETEGARATEARTARIVTATKKLTAEYPELDDLPPEASDEAHEERQQMWQAIWAQLQSTPPAIDPETGKTIPNGFIWLKAEPEKAIRYAVKSFRETYGTPVFAQAPGTSESPSARVAAAAERRSSGGDALDGSGVPRSKSGDGKPQTLADTWRQDSQKLKGREATTPSGRRLGFSA